MVDFLTRKGRSALMARIRSHGNKATELRLIRLMRCAHITGWRRQYPLYGKPDSVFPKSRLAVFVDGCFWHGCLRCYHEPKSNSMFWRNKIATNRRRALHVNRSLRENGWKVLRIWQHELRVNHEQHLLLRLLSALQ